MGAVDTTERSLGGGTGGSRAASIRGTGRGNDHRGGGSHNRQMRGLIASRRPLARRDPGQAGWSPPSRSHARSDSSPALSSSLREVGGSWLIAPNLLDRLT